MRTLSVFLTLVFVLLVLILPVVAAETTASQENKITVTASPTQVQHQNTETIERVTATQTPQYRPPPGEVVFPVTRDETPQPTTLPRTSEQVTTPPRTVTPTRTVSPTTLPATHITTVPVVTVTVIVYRLGLVYQPVDDYPYGYSYPVDYYNPAGSLTVTSNPSDRLSSLMGIITGLPGTCSPASQRDTIP